MGELSGHLRQRQAARWAGWRQPARRTRAAVARSTCCCRSPERFVGGAAGNKARRGCSRAGSVAGQPRQHKSGLECDNIALTAEKAPSEVQNAAPAPMPPQHASRADLVLSPRRQLQIALISSFGLGPIRLLGLVLSRAGLVVGRAGGLLGQLADEHGGIAGSGQREGEAQAQIRTAACLCALPCVPCRRSCCCWGRQLLTLQHHEIGGGQVRIGVGVVDQLKLRRRKGRGGADQRGGPGNMQQPVLPATLAAALHALCKQQHLSPCQD